MPTRHSPSSIALQSLLQRNWRLAPPARGHDRIGIILGDPARIRQEFTLDLRKIGRLDRYPFFSLSATGAQRCPGCLATVLHITPAPILQ